MLLLLRAEHLHIVRAPVVTLLSPSIQQCCFISVALVRVAQRRVTPPENTPNRACLGLAGLQTRLLFDPDIFRHRDPGDSS